jgi:radical SAM protein with 4Fe4S-binding SPASM domain
MFSKTLIPFFPLKITSVNGKWFTYDPLTNVEYELGNDGYYLLTSCNGFNTWEEITANISATFRLGIAEVIQRSESIMKDFTSKGIIWWRKERMHVWQMGPPETVIWDVTYRCNLSCNHCVVNAGQPPSSELTLKESKHLINELASFGVKNLVLTGGEPLLKPKFFEIANHAMNAGLSLQISTNATVITPKIAKKIAALHAGVQVSLDGATPKVHDHFRKKKGAWKLAVQGIKNLVKTQVSITVGSVVTKENFDQIPAIYALAHNLKVNQFRIMPFVPYGRGRRNFRLEVSPSKMMELTKKLDSLRASIGLPITQMPFECLLSPPPSEQVSMKTHIGCDGGISYCTITANGDVLPCNFFAGAKAENIRENSLKWIWQNAHFLNYVRSLMISDLDNLCKTCPWIVVCRGSCPAANFAHNDIFQPNCLCWRANAIQGNVIH